MRAGFSLSMSVLAVGLVGTAAAAAPEEYLVIRAMNSGASGTFVVDIEDAWWETPGERLVWQLAEPTAILDDATGEPIAMMWSCYYAIQFSPRGAVQMDFAVQAGDEETELVFQSPVLIFSALPAADSAARAWVEFTLYDQDETLDGFAEMVSTALPPGTGAFRARYNGMGPAGEMFTHLVYQMSVEGEPGQPDGAGHVSANQRWPDIGYAPIGAELSDISIDMSLRLTPGDTLQTYSGFELAQAVSGTTCPGDTDGDGQIGLPDLGLLLSAYGTCDGDAAFKAASDLDGDGCVNVSDLGFLLAIFGEDCG